MLYLARYVVVALFLGLLFWLPGFALDRLVFRRPDAAGLRPLRRIVLGLGVWMATVFALAATGELHRAALAVCGGLYLAAAVWAGVRVPDPDGRRPVRLPGWRGALGAVGVSALLAPLFFLALTPVVSWDATVYHLSVPKLYLEHQGFRPIELNVYSNWPLNVELLYAVALAFDGPVLAKLVHFGFGLAVLYALYAGCRAFARPAAGWLAMLLFLANGVVGFELRVAYVELAHAFFLLAAFCFLHQARETSSDDREPLLAAGICGGLVAGIKLTGVVGVAILGTLYLPRLLDARQIDLGKIAMRRFAAFFLLPVVVLALPWLVKAAWHTGNPVYPFFHGVFGGLDWGPELSKDLAAWQRSIGMGRSPVDFLLLPVRVFLSGEQGDYGRFDGELGGFWLALLPLALLSLRRSLVRRALGVSALFFLFWALSSQQIRLLVPVLPLLALAASVAVVDLVARLRPARWRRPALAVALAGAVALVVTSHGRLYGAGLRTLGVFLRAEHGALMASAVHPVYGYLDRELPADAKILMLNTNHVFHSPRETLADSFFEASQIARWLRPARDADEAAALLAARGVTHVVLENRPWRVAYPPGLLELLSDRTRTPVAWRSADGRYTVFALR